MLRLGSVLKANMCACTQTPAVAPNFSSPGISFCKQLPPSQQRNTDTPQDLFFLQNARRAFIFQLPQCCSSRCSFSQLSQPPVTHHGMITKRKIRILACDKKPVLQPRCSLGTYFTHVLRKLSVLPSVNIIEPSAACPQPRTETPSSVQSLRGQSRLTAPAQGPGSVLLPTHPPLASRSLHAGDQTALTEQR